MLGILVLFWSGGIAAADTIKGGVDIGLDAPRDAALIQKNEKTVCIGAIFNSFTVFGSALCEVDLDKPSDYTIIPAWQAGMPDKAKIKRLPVFNIADVMPGSATSPNSTDPFKVRTFRVMIPGFEMITDAVHTLFITEWEKWMSIVNINKTTPGSVLSWGPPVKQGAITYEYADAEKCNKTYNTMKKKPGWPQFMPFETFCIFPSKDPFSSSAMNKSAPGATACGDSMGSPVYALDDGGMVTIGILLVAMCSPEIGIAIGSPDFLVDTVYTPSDVGAENVTSEPGGGSPRVPGDDPTGIPFASTHRGGGGGGGGGSGNKSTMGEPNFPAWCLAVLLCVFLKL